MQLVGVPATQCAQRRSASCGFAAWVAPCGCYFCSGECIGDGLVLFYGLYDVIVVLLARTKVTIHCCGKNACMHSQHNTKNELAACIPHSSTFNRGTHPYKTVSAGLGISATAYHASTLATASCRPLSAGRLRRVRSSLMTASASLSYTHRAPSFSVRAVWMREVPTG